MSSAGLPTNKVCPKCGKSDKTEFSSCRFCGTKYDFKAPESKELNLMIPTILVICVVLGGAVAFSVLQYKQEAAKYSHPELLVGKTLNCKGKSAEVFVNKADLQQFDVELAEATKRSPGQYGSKGVGGVIAASSALDNLNSGKDDKISLTFRYIGTRQLSMVQGDDKSPVSVSVLSADNSGKFPTVQVKVLNGEDRGHIYWMNADQLDL